MNEPTIILDPQNSATGVIYDIDSLKEAIIKTPVVPIRMWDGGNTNDLWDGDVCGEAHLFMQHGVLKSNLTFDDNSIYPEQTPHLASIGVREADDFMVEEINCLFINTDVKQKD